jgi:two-component system, chemotaxis family, protein-glutamate methylesterase/glutaminase
MKLNTSPIKLLVVDDSAVARGIITALIKQHQDIQVVGYCRDGRSVAASIDKLKPDVITLDVEMPHINGPELLAKLSSSLKTPVIMVSGVTARGAQVTLECLALGAVDFVLKPQLQAAGTVESAIEKYGAELIAKIRAAAFSVPQPADLTQPVPSLPQLDIVASESNHTVIAIGASTGGPNAVANLLREIPADCPPIVVAIHMPTPFTALYADRIKKFCKPNVVHAKNGDLLTSGTVYIAPGDHHISVVKRSNLVDRNPPYAIRLIKPQETDLIKPNIDVLFKSIGHAVGKNALVCILTGMGKDGAAGSLVVHQEGGTVFAQDQKSSVIYGMPKAAVNEGHVDKQIDLREFPKAISQYLKQTRI